MFRELKAGEIELRVGTCKEKWFTLLLYKDARCDMNILDETVGSYGWKREHTRDNRNCIVSLWDEKKNQWIPKEDTGVESNSMAEKGLASDSFKRACVNWGIGRELYTAPFIFVNKQEYIKPSGNKYAVREKFVVAKIETTNGIISFLEINDSKGKNVYKFGSFKNPVVSNEPTPAPTLVSQKEKAVSMILKKGSKYSESQLMEFTVDALRTIFKESE